MATYDSPNSDRSREINDRDAPVAAVSAGNGRPVRDDVVDREKERFGGIKWGSAFFGLLTATGTAVILTALLAAIGTVVGASTVKVLAASPLCSLTPLAFGHLVWQERKNA